LDGGDGTTGERGDDDERAKWPSSARRAVRGVVCTSGALASRLATVSIKNRTGKA